MNRKAVGIHVYTQEYILKGKSSVSSPRRFSVYILHKHPKWYGVYGPYFGKCISICCLCCLNVFLPTGGQIHWFVRCPVSDSVLCYLRFLERVSLWESLRELFKRPSQVGIQGPNPLLQRSQKLSFSSTYCRQILKQLPTLVVTFSKCVTSSRFSFPL